MKLNYSQVRSKLELDGERVVVTVERITELVSDIFKRAGCPEKIAIQVSNHLVDSNLCGMESHGLMRTLQYVEQFENGYMKPDVVPEVSQNDAGAWQVSGKQGIGIPAMQLAVEQGCELAQQQGISAVAIRDVGHTGRLGAFTEQAANVGFLCIVIGGGGRQNWRQVAPHGGRRAMLPTNPYCIGIPGGERGPVVLDFATSKIAGGWIYAARSAGAKLPDNVLIDSQGEISRDPEDYFTGGAILPAGRQRGMDCL